MQKMTNFDAPLQFFAAANGYTGFRSYFDKVFKTDSYERIFVLKGGPGTGKSSLLKEILNFATSECLYSESILCSSDPHSLDGVIIEKNGRRFAVLDGTAPHARDAEMPGAIDEIINLGENWNSDDLRKNRKMIKELCEKKKNNYDAGYFFLKKAGELSLLKSEVSKDLIKDKSLKSEAKSLAESLIKNERQGKIEYRLIDSFGRFGRFSLDTLDKISERTITVKNIGAASFIFMSELVRRLEEAKTSVTIFPSVFSGDEIEGIYLPETKSAILLSDSPSCTVDTENFIRKSCNTEVDTRIDSLYCALLDEAQKYFTFASDLHFELEKLYIKAMNFSRNAHFVTKIIEKIKKESE